VSPPANSVATNALPVLAAHAWKGNRNVPEVKRAPAHSQATRTAVSTAISNKSLPPNCLDILAAVFWIEVVSNAKKAYPLAGRSSGRMDIAGLLAGDYAALLRTDRVQETGVRAILVGMS
jgi:hypothetical protein